MLEITTKRIWLKSLLAGVAALALASWAGPLLVAAQAATRAYTPGGNCGNDVIELPNTDAVSWRLSGGTAAAYEAACVTHDHCYNTLGMTKQACDLILFQDMLAGCRSTYDALGVRGGVAAAGRMECGLQAATYLAAIGLLPPVEGVYCYEQYYARTGSRTMPDNLLAPLLMCGWGF
jgi:hypothetical protein